MRADSFFKLVEIRTKLASMIPLLLGTVYACLRFQRFSLTNFFLFFISLLSLDMAVTAINNYCDFRKTFRKYGYNYESHNAIVRDNLKQERVLAVIIVLLCVSASFGFLLFIRTNYLLLILGGLSAGVGIMYSFGPVPISRTPFGELFSGFFMGFVITFLAAYIHIYDINIVSFDFTLNSLKMAVNIPETMYILIFSIPSIMGISGIMLANNICDMEDDRENNRFTLPLWIGREKALLIFTGLYFLTALDFVVLALTGILPLYTVFILIVFIPVIRNIKTFRKIQTKKDTFVLSVKNYVFIGICQLIFTIPSLLRFSF